MNEIGRAIFDTLPIIALAWFMWVVAVEGD